MAQQGFIDLDEAARRSGKHRGHLQRLCVGWEAEGKARKERPADGGKARWVVAEDADSAFARVRQPDVIGVDLRGVPAAKRDAAVGRRATLKRWEAFCGHAFALGFDRDRATNSFIESELLEGRRVSRSRLYAWDAAYRAEGLIGLVDRRGGSDEKPAADDPFLAEVKRLYLHVRKPKLTICRELAIHAARERGWTIRTYKACQRMVAAIPTPVIYKLRGGEESYVNNAEPFVERDYTTLRSNEIWCSDHHQFDVIVRDGDRLLRPWLTAFQDVRSRKIVAWSVYAHDPNSDAIFTAFRQGVLDHGVPEGMLIDNGKDYDCYALNGRTKRDRWQKRRVRVDLGERAEGLFPALGIAIQHARPYHGQSKPIERWFGTVEQQTPCWDTYCGNSPANRPRTNLGKDDVQLAIERGKAPTLAVFAEWFNDWVDAYNAGHAHQGQGMAGRTPDQVFDACLEVRRTAPAELLDVLCLRKVGPVRVAQNGVTYQQARYGQHEPALHRLLGEQVYLRVDERDVGQVQVYATDDRFICIAKANVALPFKADAQTLRAAIREKRADRELIREYGDRRTRLGDDLPERIVRAARAKAAAARSAGGDSDQSLPSLRPVRHALEGALPALREAVDADSMRLAVGAEGATASRFIYQQSPAADVVAAEEAAPVAGMSFRELMARKPWVGTGHE